MEKEIRLNERWKSEIEKFMINLNDPHTRTKSVKIEMNGLSILRSSNKRFFHLKVICAKDVQVVKAYIDKFNVNHFFVYRGELFSVPTVYRAAFLKFKKKGITLRYQTGYGTLFELYYKNDSVFMSVDLDQEVGYLKTKEKTFSNTLSFLDEGESVYIPNTIVTTHKSEEEIALLCDNIERVMHTRKEVDEAMKVVATEKGYRYRRSANSLDINGVLIPFVCPITSDEDFLLLKTREHSFRNTRDVIGEPFKIIGNHVNDQHKELEKWMKPILKEIRYSERLNAGS